jgi:hypothetical protein
LQAKVVRVHNDLLAVQFIHLDDAQKMQLYDCLMRELNTDI